ncbi:unnamed protein product [Bursaphelenchus okinawaensis]|uniref:Uncharacterized protein n=1 Tax=Bursaphelenchus okinawaensis TaxID=465554 RepID=A0A811LAP0_9BILA|nr:unnamed protein product [Bursaphelenchus okinawaensis]CAG9120637.1 unnamed protein product [Bursaphelenchus okinawaensis]
MTLHYFMISPIPQQPPQAFNPRLRQAILKIVQVIFKGGQVIRGVGKAKQPFSTVKKAKVIADQRQARTRGPTSKFTISANISKSTVSPNGYSLVQTCEPNCKGVELDTLMMQLSGAVSVPPRPSTIPSHRQRKPSAEKLCKSKKLIIIVGVTLLILFILWRLLLRSYLLPYTLTKQELEDSLKTTTTRPDINRPPEMSWNESDLLHRPVPTDANEVLGTEFFKISADLPVESTNHEIHQKIQIDHFPTFDRQHPKQIGRFGDSGVYTTRRSSTSTVASTTTTGRTSTTKVLKNDDFRDELNDLIDELDQQGNGDGIDHTTTTKKPLPVPLVVRDDDEDVRPVEMSFGDDDWSMNPIDHHEEHQATLNKHFHQKYRPPTVPTVPNAPSEHTIPYGRHRPSNQIVPTVPDTPEPVWRIKPPNLGEDIPPPPPPKRPVMNIQATMKTYESRRHPQRQKQVVTQEDDPLRDTPVIVTALLDIGRGNWERFTRPYDLYLSYLMDLLGMRNRIIVYCDSAAKDFLHNQELSWNRIQLVEITLADLPFYKFRDEISKILQNEQENWKDSWDLKVKSHPEALYADYNILVNSKPYFMYNATKISYFEADTFVWVDAGYSHGSRDIIPQSLWDPELPKDKITVIKITPEIDKSTKYTLDLVYRKQWTVISGGVIAGDRSSIRRFNMFFLKVFLDLLNDNFVDDDQTTLLMTIKDYFGMFNILTGGWFDAFRLIPLRS